MQPIMEVNMAAYSDLANRDLRDMNFEHESFIFSNLVNSELPNSMIGANLFGADLVGVRLAMRCSTFHGLVIDQKNFKMLMYILSKMKVHGPVDKTVRKQLKELMKKPELSYEDFLKALVPEAEYKLMEQHSEDGIL